MEIKLLASPALAAVARRFLERLKPSPRLKVSEWADQYRQLSREASSEPGRWRTSRAEYQRGIMDAIGDPAVKRVVVMKGSQVGWTEIVNNAVGYFSHHDPSSMLMIQPTVEMAEAWSKERLAPMIRDTSVMKGLFKDPRSRDSGNTLRQKQFDGGYVAIIGANAPAGLASRPIRVVLADEVDRYSASAGTEGDPIKLAEQRQATFWNRRTLIGSTPGVKTRSIIEREYKRSDMRRFYVPCPHCSEPQTLEWRQVKWDKAANGDHLPDTAHYQCEFCGVLWTDAERWDAIRAGEWRASAPFAGTAGFHVSQIYSPWLPMATMVRQFVDAQGNPLELMVFVNTVLGETWEEQGEAVGSHVLKSHRESYGPDDLPEGVHYATAGVDVQGDRLEVEIVGWGVADESWGIRYDVLPGDPAQLAVWNRLDELLKEQFWTESGRLVRVRAAAIDTGGHHGAQVLAFCRPRAQRLIYPIKGAAGARPVWPKRSSKTGDSKDRIWLVGVDTAKDAIYGRFRIAMPDGGAVTVPGYCHLPQDYDEEWFEQVTSERVMTRYKEGRPYRVWVIEKGKRNEALDCRVYAFAARMSLDARMTKPSTITVAPETPKEQRMPTTPAPRAVRRGVRNAGMV
jgi:phage terminase large subunit GpA-like protein